MDIDVSKLSPMMKHYIEIKENYKDCVVMYRLGDFYEMFFDDAVVVSKELELTLTGRDCGLDKRAPMCGVPYHAVDNYIARLINKGYKVAICEQLTNPEDSKGMLDRDVVRVITAGTVIEDGILDDKKNNYISSIYKDKQGFGLCWADISTGEMNLVQFTGENALKNVENALNSIHSAEIIANSEAKGLIDPEAVYRLRIQTYFDWAYRYKTAHELLCKTLNVSTLDGFECEDKPLAVQAAGGLMQYFLDTQKRSLTMFTKLNYQRTREIMFLDTSTRRNLELVETIRDRRKTGTLLWLLDKTSTSMGARLLRKWVDNPLVDEEKINARLQSVATLIANPKLKTELILALQNMRDLERLAGKVSFGSVNPRDMYGIANCLVALPVIKSLLVGVKDKNLAKIRSMIYDFTNICKLVCMAIKEDAPILISDGGFIADGFDTEVDSLRKAESSASDWVKEYEARERERTGIRTLKIGYNKVFGYYIEVTKSNINLVPLEYRRKQTTINSERYKTAKLSEFEEKIVGAREKCIKKEIQIFHYLKEKLQEHCASMIETAKAVSALDCLLSFATVSVENKYVQPKVSSKIKGYNIINGRHPVVEKLLPMGKFIANDCIINNDSRTMLITGPNMAGKSTYMRQVALITLMAHIGCYVPCDKAEIPLTDRIFTRVGASDDLTNSQSTFMVEMVEVANILNNATKNSLLILDEIGRGTSTQDGLSIAWSVLEYVDKKLQCKTLFSTHYHELTELEGKLDGVKNYRVLVDETNEKVVFLHRIQRGGTSKSFGIEVASLAGVPKEVTDRAREISKILDTREGADTLGILQNSMGEVKHEQQDMFTSQLADTILNELKETNIDNITPMQALVILADLTKRAKNG